MPGRCRFETLKPVSPAFGCEPRPVAPSSRISPPAPVDAPGNGEIAVGWLCVSTFISTWTRSLPRRIARRVGVALGQPALDRRGLPSPRRCRCRRRPCAAAQRCSVFRIIWNIEQRLRDAVDREGRVEDLVAAVLAVGLREHHQLDVGRVAAELRERVDAGSRSRRPRAPGRRRGSPPRARRGRRRARRRDAIGRAGCSSNRCARVFADRTARISVMRSCSSAATASRSRRVERLRAAEKAASSAPADIRVTRSIRCTDEAAVVRDVGRLRGPRRDRAQARRDDDHRGAVARPRTGRRSAAARPGGRCRRASAARRSRPSARGARRSPSMRPTMACSRGEERRGAETPDNALPPSKWVRCLGWSSRGGVGGCGSRASSRLAAVGRPRWKPAILRPRCDNSDR